MCEWDEAKNQTITAGRPGFEAVEEFEWETAMIFPSPRHGESRWSAIGFIGDRLHYVVYAHRADVTRVISLRKANRREMRTYAKA